MRLAKMTYAYAACTVCVTIFSTGGKFWPISKFTELHGLIPATRSYALLLKYINHWVNSWAYLDAPLQTLAQRQHQIGFEFPNDKSHNYNFSNAVSLHNQYNHHNVACDLKQAPTYGHHIALMQQYVSFTYSNDFLQ